MRTRIHARADEADPPAAYLDQMLGGRPAAVEMREAHQHIDRIWSGFHYLHHRAAGRLKQLSRQRRLVDAGHDQCRRALRGKHLQQPFLLKARIMRVAHLDAEWAVRKAVIDAAHHLGEDVVGKRRH